MRGGRAGVAGSPAAPVRWRRRLGRAALRAPDSALGTRPEVTGPAGRSRRAEGAGGRSSERAAAPTRGAGSGAAERDPPEAPGRAGPGRGGDASRGRAGAGGRRAAE